jgi:predicted DNA-binding transcriptional regulator AlpA
VARPEVTGKRPPWKAPAIPADAEFNDERILDLSICAALSGVCPQTFRDWVRNGMGPRTVQLGPRKRGVIFKEYRRWREQRQLAV